MATPTPKYITNFELVTKITIKVAAITIIFVIGTIRLFYEVITKWSRDA